MAQNVLITPASTKIAFTDSGDTTTVLKTSSGRFEFKDSGESNFVDLYANDIVLDGNLTVGGTTTTVNTSNILIEDPILQLAKGQTSGSPTVDIGFVGLRGASNNAAFIWDESDDVFAAILTTGDGSATTLTPASYADFKAGLGTFSTAVAVGDSYIYNNYIRSSNLRVTDNGYIGSQSVQSVIQIQGDGDVAIGYPTSINSTLTLGGDITMGTNQIIFNNNSQAIQIKDAAGTASYVLYQDNADTLIVGNGTNVEKIRFDTGGHEGALAIDTNGVVTLHNLEPLHGNDSGYLGSTTKKWKQVWFGIMESDSALSPTIKN